MRTAAHRYKGAVIKREQRTEYNVLYMASAESIKEVPFVKYLGHVISADMKYDRDKMRQCRQL